MTRLGLRFARLVAVRGLGSSAAVAADMATKAPSIRFSNGDFVKLRGLTTGARLLGSVNLLFLRCVLQPSPGSSLE